MANCPVREKGRGRQTISDPTRKKRRINSENDEESSISVFLTDPKVLECKICCEILTSPLYHSKNGHTVCSSCCTLLGRKCPTCSCRIGNLRSRELESLLESLKLSCPNEKFGCKEIVDCSMWKEHQEACTYAACSCPFPECSFVSSSSELPDHCASQHKDSSVIFTYDNHFSLSFNVEEKQLILQEKNEGDLFLLHNSSVDENVGYLLSVGCVAPKSCKFACDYMLTCHSERTVGNSVVLNSVTENYGSLPDGSSKESLLFWYFSCLDDINNIFDFRNNTKGKTTTRRADIAAKKTQGKESEGYTLNKFGREQTI